MPYIIRMCKMVLLLGWQTSVQHAYTMPLHAKIMAHRCRYPRENKLHCTGWRLNHVSLLPCHSSNVGGASSTPPPFHTAVVAIPDSSYRRALACGHCSHCFRMAVMMSFCGCLTSAAEDYGSCGHSTHRKSVSRVMLLC